jgi:hypothetical protein
VVHFQDHFSKQGICPGKPFTGKLADEIYFVNSGEVLRAGSLDDAVNLLLHGKRES